MHNCSMVGGVLIEAIDRACLRCGVRVIYVGDPAQLPPVGEKTSPAWALVRSPDCRALLKEVMRNDSGLLAVATAVRRRIKEGRWETPLHRGISVPNVYIHASRDHFLDRLYAPDYDPRATKVIAWRNRAVEEYNRGIREHLGLTGRFCIGDVLLLAEPVEVNGNLVAHVDDEFLVEGVHDDSIAIPTEQGPLPIDTHRLHLAGDQKMMLHIPRVQFVLDEQLSAKAAIARRAKGMGRTIAWRDFWETKKRFGNVRYGYALTAHRAQGSTYRSVFVDQHDVLANHDSREAFRCLYVAVTRPSDSLHVY